MEGGRREMCREKKKEQTKDKKEKKGKKSILVPRGIILPSAHHSPKTVKRNASEFVMGTVRLNSARNRQISSSFFSDGPKQTRLDNPIEKRFRGGSLPAFPTSKKNQTLPVRLITKGIEYAGDLSKFSTVQMALAILA